MMEPTTSQGYQNRKGIGKFMQWIVPSKNHKIPSKKRQARSITSAISDRCSTRKGSDAPSSSKKRVETYQEMKARRLLEKNGPPTSISFPISSNETLTTRNDSTMEESHSVATSTSRVTGRTPLMPQEMEAWEAAMEDASEASYDCMMDAQRSMCRTLGSEANAVVTLQSCFRKNTTCFVHLFAVDDSHADAIDAQLEQVATSTCQNNNTTQFIRIERSSHLTGYLGFSPRGPCILAAMYGGEVIGQLADFTSTECSEVVDFVEEMKEKIQARIQRSE